MRLLFIGDPLASLKPAKDSTVAMIRAAWQRGHDCWYCGPETISLHYAGSELTPSIAARCLKPSTDKPTRLEQKPVPDLMLSWATTGSEQWLSHKDFDLVIMRKDPPFDEAFFAATQMLTALEHAGLPVINRPSALRDHGEKMAVLEFPQYAAPGLVSSNIKQLKDFAGSHQKVVFKPLDAMGGAGVFVTSSSDPNLPVILEMLTQNEARAIMAQTYLPEIVKGDKRVLLINGEPVPYCLARIPPEGASRGNLAAGGKGVAQPLNENDEAIAKAIGPTLASRGLFLVGLDIIGTRLTEINVTSPTGFQEISAQTPANVGELFISAVERAYGP
ncbi:MAG: glutathione synthase [Burkholderiaceae bacterium]